MYYVYRYTIGDQWIYVGKSEKNLDQRIRDHAKDRRFQPYSKAVIEYCELNTKTDMDITESMLIKTMHPLINVADGTDGSIPFVYNEDCVKWLSYESSKFKPKSDKRNNFEIAVRRRRDVFSNLLQQKLPLNISEINHSFYFSFEEKYWNLIDMGIQRTMLKHIVDTPIIIGLYKCVVSYEMLNGIVYFDVECEYCDSAQE